MEEGNFDGGWLRDLPAAEAPRFWVRPDGGRLAWNEYGDPAGRPMFYYHGWPSSRWQARMVHHLARKQGLRVIAMDRPGMGRSDRVPGRQLGDWPRLMAGFADRLGLGRFGQLGVSGGGPYVMACAAAMPGRVAGSAILCGATPLGGGLEGMHPAYRLMARMRKLPPAVFTAIFRAGGRVPMRWWLRALPRVDREWLRAHRESLPLFVRSFREGVRQGGRGVIGDADVYFGPWPEGIRELKVPVHWWHGMGDENIPLSRVKEYLEGISGAVLHEERGLGHFSLALERAGAALVHLGGGRW